jgi:DNA-binding transcriptional MerR regulator
VPAEKEPGALLTIGELSQQLGVAQHILRYWETRFPQLKPMQRAGNRRYYRPAEVELAQRINRLLNHEGYTVRGVQKLLRDRNSAEESPQDDFAAAIATAQQATAEVPSHEEPVGVDVFRLIALRNRLSEALES